MLNLMKAQTDGQKIAGLMPRSLMPISKHRLSLLVEGTSYCFMPSSLNSKPRRLAQTTEFELFYHSAPYSLPIKTRWLSAICQNEDIYDGWAYTISSSICLTPLRRDCASISMKEAIESFKENYWQKSVPSWDGCYRVPDSRYRRWTVADFLDEVQNHPARYAKLHNQWLNNIANLEVVKELANYMHILKGGLIGVSSIVEMALRGEQVYDAHW